MMSLENEIVKKFMNQDSKNRITQQLTELLKLYKFTKLEIIYNEIDLSIINLEGLNVYKSIAYEISKLSINLYLDFYHYKRLYFKSNFDKPIYNERLKSLGYENSDGLWKCKLINKPNISVVIDNVFVYNFFCQLIEKEPNYRNSLPDNYKHRSTDFRIVNDISNKNAINNNEIDKFKRNTISFASNNIKEKETKQKFEESKNEDNFYNLRQKNYQADVKLNNHEIENKHLRASWICQDCTFVNDLKTENCEACFNSNESKIGLEKTFKDNLKIKGQSIIEECSDTEQDSVLVPLPVISTPVVESIFSDNIETYCETFWVCSICTFKNKSDCINCATCMNSCKMTPTKPANNNNNNNNNDNYDTDTDIPLDNLTDKQTNENDWICQNCKITNKGTEKKCKTCSEIMLFNSELINDGNSILIKSFNGDGKTSESKSGLDGECLRCGKIAMRNHKDLCPKCSKYYVCPNEACNFVNINKYCSKCHVKFDSVLQNGNRIKTKYRLMHKDKWQCPDCMRINSIKREKCKNCDVFREKLSTNR